MGNLPFSSLSDNLRICLIISYSDETSIFSFIGKINTSFIFIACNFLDAKDLILYGLLCHCLAATCVDGFTRHRRGKGLVQYWLRSFPHIPLSYMKLHGKIRRFLVWVFTNWMTPQKVGILGPTKKNKITPAHYKERCHLYSKQIILPV